MSMSYDTPVTYLTIKQYADQAQISTKTVNRYLADDELPGATKDERGRWLIPADAVRTPATGAELVAMSPRTSPTTDLLADLRKPIPTLDELVAELPAFVPLDTAAEILEISRHAIATHREYFDVVPFGPNGSLVIPRATIKRIRG